MSKQPRHNTRGATMAQRRPALMAGDKRGFYRTFFCYLALGYSASQAWRIARIAGQWPRPRGE